MVSADENMELTIQFLLEEVRRAIREMKAPFGNPPLCRNPSLRSAPRRSRFADRDERAICVWLALLYESMGRQTRLGRWSPFRQYKMVQPKHIQISQTGIEQMLAVEVGMRLLGAPGSESKIVLRRNS
jgi:hypothetical protein